MYAQNARDNGVNIAGPVYTFYLFDEISSQDHARYLAQCCASVD